MSEAAFTWGSGGEKLSPSERRRRVAEAMMAKGADASPVGHWTQGAARVLQAMYGAMQLRDADAAEKAGLAEQAGRNALLMGGGGTTPVATAAANPTADPSAAVAATPAALAPVFTTKEAEYKLPTNYLPQVAKIESSFNPSAANPNSSARGLFQFTKGTARDYGLANPMDPIASTDAAARLAADNAKTLTNVLGRAPTAGELYLAHQQGGGGASKLLANPNARAIDVVGRDAVINNGGNANMTAAEFARRWTNKVAANEADLPAQDATVAEAPGAAPGFAIPPAPAPVMDGATFNAIANGVDAAPLEPVFQMEGMSQPWMGTALTPVAPAAPQVARASMPPPRPADLPAPGAVEAIGQAPVAAAPVAGAPAPIIADPTKDNAGVLSGLVASEEARKGLPSGAGIMSPFGGTAAPAASPTAANDQSVFSRIASALGGGSAAPASPAAAPSPAVQAVAAALPAQDASTPAAAPSAGASRVAAAMATLNSPYARPGERAIAQQIVQQAFKDPTEAELKRLTVEKARREAENAPLDTEGKRLEIEGKKKALGKAEAPTVQRIKQPDGSEVAVQWDQGKKAWVPLEAPQGGNAVGGSAGNPYALPGKPTEDQSKSAGFANRMAEAHTILDRVEEVGADKGQTTLDRLPFGLNNMAISKERQSYNQAKENFITAVLRKESGAVISDGEFKREEQKYFPQPGDTPEQLAQKRQSRITAMKSMMGSAGSGYKIPDGLNLGEKKSANGKAIDTSKPGSFKFNPATGKMEPA